MVKKGEFVGTFLAVLTALISGFSIFANKIFIITLDPTIFAALRAMFIGAIFFVLSLAANNWTFKEFSKFSWKYLALIGIIGGGLAFWLFFSGLKLTTSGKAGFIHKTLPIYVTILAFIFLKEKISKRQLFAVGTMFVGTILLLSATVNPGEFWLNPQLGDLLVLCATILWGVENVLAKKAMIRGENNYVVSFARMFFGAVFLFGVLLFSSKLSLILSLTGQQILYISISTFLLFFYVLTYYASLRYINVSKAASILMISPIITLFLGVFILNEPAPLLQLIGSAIILVGAYFILTSRSEFDRI